MNAITLCIIRINKMTENLSHDNSTPVRFLQTLTACFY